MTHQIEVKIDKHHLSVKPGETVLATMTLRNFGLDSEALEIWMEGIPVGWIFNLPPKVYLSKGATRQITFSVQPPLSPQSKAGYYPFKVNISRENKRDALLQRLPLRLTVGAYSQFKSFIRPQRLKVGSTLQIAVENQSNILQNFILSCQDNDAQLSFHPPEGRLSIPPGKTEAMEFRAVAHRAKLFGAAQTHQLSAAVRLSGETSETQTLVAQAKGAPLLPYWTLPLAATLFLIFGLSALLFSPFQETTAAPQTQVAFIENTSENTNAEQRVAEINASASPIASRNKPVERDISPETTNENRRPAMPEAATPPPSESVAALLPTLPATASSQAFVAALPSPALNPSNGASPAAPIRPDRAEPTAIAPTVASETTAAPPVTATAVTEPITNTDESVIIALLPSATTTVTTATTELSATETTPAPTETLPAEVPPAETPTPVPTETLSPPPTETPPTVYGATLIPVQSINEGAPGETLTYTLTLQNQSSAEDAFALSLTLPPDWSAEYPPQLPPLPGGAQQAISITLTIPPHTSFENTYPFTLTATSLTDPNSVNSVLLSVRVLAEE